MKKLIALLLAVVVMVSITGCAAKPDILGSYRAEFDAADLVIDAFNGTENYEAPGFPYSKYIPSFPVVLNLTFREDGTFSMSTDTDALSTSLDNVLTALDTMMEDIMFSIVQQQMSAQGVYVESIDHLKELQKLTGSDWDSTVSGILSDETFVSMNQQTISELFSALSTPYTIEGNYTAQGGKLYVSLNLKIPVSESCYFTYEPGEDGSVSLTGMTGVELPHISCPITLTPTE